jgi:hypothetical protein
MTEVKLIRAYVVVKLFLGTTYPDIIDTELGTKSTKSK